MSIPAQYVAEFEKFPAVLRRLVQEELAAGNQIAELSNGFPAPPIGSYIKLANIVTTRPRIPDGVLDFYERNSSLHSGEFTDEKRFFFVLEPPLPPQPELDMNASPCATEPPTRPYDAHGAANQIVESNVEGLTRSFRASSAIVERFRESMTIDYERWRDGTGYDLALLKFANKEELTQIESLLLDHPIGGWRDVEALATLDTPMCRERLTHARVPENAEVTLAIIKYAPWATPETERTKALVAALKSAKAFDGLQQVLDLVEIYHPPEVVDALWHGVLTRDGETAISFAALLLFVYGETDEAFDCNLRPFFLTFNTEDPSERLKRFYDLCERVNIDGDALLARITHYP